MSFWVAALIVCVWEYRREARRKAKRIAELEGELDKAIKDRHDVQVKLNARIAGERYVEKLDEWPEEIQ
jgi:hypothetical protein